MTEWQLIETAPKDGTRILAYSAEGLDGPMQAVVYWYVHEGEKFVEASVVGLYQKEKYELDWWEGAGFTLFLATHWMPLPEPPKTANN